MTEAAAQDEKTFVENEFGTVTSKRVIYYRAKGWFSGGSREDIPLQHVTSVRLDTSRSIIVGVLFFPIGLVVLTLEGGFKAFGVALLFLALRLLA